MHTASRRESHTRRYAPGALIMLIIEHESRGRLRLRSTALKRAPDVAAAVAARAAETPGVLRAEARAATGSLIIRFDDRLSRCDILRAVEIALRDAVEEPHGRRESDPEGRAVGEASDVARGIAWHAGPLAEVALRLDADAATGLSSEDAARRLRRFGPNRPPEDAPTPAWRLAAKQVDSLPVAMLAVSALASAATGGFADATATGAIVLANAAIGYVTEAQAERSIRALTGDSRRSVDARRDGGWTRVRVDALAPGDVIRLRAGMQAPADARIIRSRGLRADESPLTGESAPADKLADDGLPEATPLGDRRNMLHAGGLLVAGSAEALVAATGSRTAAGRIQALSATAARPVAPVEAELDRLGADLAKLCLVASVVVFGAGWLRGYALAEIFKDSLALAVAAVPEGLPMVATTTLSRGLRRMERKGVLIRQLSAVESLGAASALCLDKTGTLTENRMAVVAAAVGDDEVALDEPRARRRLARIATAAALNAEPLEDGASRSGTERALAAFAGAIGRDPEGLAAARPVQRIIERRPGRPWMATTHGGRGRRLLVKGAPGAVLARCARIRDGGAPRPLSDAGRAAILRLNDRLAARPARVLGFAEGAADPIDEDDVRDLVWIGMLGLADPIRADAAPLIARLRAAGAAPMMITGDQGGTARAVADAVGLSGGEPLRIVDAGELGAVPPDLLAGLVHDTHLFARVSPEQKLLIVRALQDAGHVVAMTGDGVNDGPALRAADVGVAMGAGGADLARAVANVVIRDDRLETLGEAVAQGRAVRRNIRRALEYLITTNVSEILVGLVEAARGPGELETPLELLWLNLVTDVLPGLGLALAEPEDDAMRRSPQPRHAPVIPREDLRRIAGDAALIAGAALAAHFTAVARYGPGPRTRGVTFAALSFGQLLYTLVSQRSDPRRLPLRRLFENRTLDLALIGAAALAAAPHLIPGLRRLVGVAPLSGGDWVLALSAAATPTGTVLARRGVRIMLTREAIERC